MKKIILSEEQIQKVCESYKNWRGYEDYKSYQAEDELETLEFRVFHQEDTGLPVKILIDDGESYIIHEHPLFIYFQNGTQRTDGIIPVSVSPNPRIMIKNVPKLKISQKDLSDIFTFIRQNLSLLWKVANKEISGIYSYDLIKPIKKKLHESLLLEMSSIPKEVTGLPVDIWVDEGVPLQHALRIKFRASKEQHTTREYSSMTIEDEPVVFNLPKKLSVSSKDIEMIKNFVRYNKERLIDLNIGNIKYKQDFLPKMIKIGKNGGPIYPEELFKDELKNQVKHQTIDDLRKREYSTPADVLVNDKKKKKKKKNKNKKS